MSTAILCSFTSGLDDLTRKQQCDPVAVLRVLQATGRFSVFEATANQTIARMMTRLMHKQCIVVRDGVRTEYGKLLKKTGGEFPWTTVELTAGGLKLLADAEKEAP